MHIFGHQKAIHWCVEQYIYVSQVIQNMKPTTLSFSPWLYCCLKCLGNIRAPNLATHISFFYRECNRTHLASSIKYLVQEKLPNHFQSHILCAGSDVGIQGSCKRDSGGPLMYLNREEQQCKYFTTTNQSSV